MQGAEGPEALAGACEGLPKRDGHLHSHAAEALVRVRFRLHNSYLNFVECLRYFDEALVTDELMQYAVSLIDGFDDIIDDPSVGDEMKPTPVNIREMFIGEKTLGRGKYGTVYLGTVRGSPERVALKRINKANMTPQDAKNVMVVSPRFCDA